jgi:hypothetical protein
MQNSIEDHDVLSLIEDLPMSVFSSLVTVSNLGSNHVDVSAVSKLVTTI